MPKDKRPTFIVGGVEVDANGKPVGAPEDSTPSEVLTLREQLATAERERDDVAKAKDGAYHERDQLVAALTKVFPASIEQHVGEGWDEAWRNVVIVDLPTGQASWHIHDSELPLFAHLPRDAGRVWDGHTTKEKYARLAALLPQPLLPTDALKRITDVKGVGDKLAPVILDALTAPAKGG